MNVFNRIMRLSGVCSVHINLKEAAAQVYLTRILYRNIMFQKSVSHLRRCVHLCCQRQNDSSETIFYPLFSYGVSKWRF